MRKTWQSTALVMLAALWPQVGCVQLPAGKSVQETRPLPEKLTTAQKQALSPAEIVQAWFNHADTLEKARKTNEAIAVYEQIRQAGGEPAWDATKKLALLYYRTEKMERAEQEYRFLLQHNPKDADALYQMGNIAYGRSHWPTAAKYFDDAVYHAPDHKHAITGLGYALAQQGHYHEGVKELTKVISEAEAYCKVAEVLKSQSKWDDAIRALQTAANLDPTNRQVLGELVKLESSRRSSTTVVRLTTPQKKKDRQGIVELEEPSATLAQNSDEGMSRLRLQRPTLPPLPDVDLSAGNGREWECSAKKSDKNR